MKLTRREFAAIPGLPLLAVPSEPLSTPWPPARLSAALLPRDRYKPFPTAADRAQWESVPADAREPLIEAGARNLHTDWPSLPATLFLEYRREGNRSRYERVRDTRRRKLGDLVIAECLEGKGRFLDDIANGVWTTCEETFWGVPAHLGMQKAGVGLPDVSEPIVDLFAAETSSLLSWTAYLVGPRLDKVSPLVLERIHIETNRRLLTPNLERLDFGWMGLNPRGRGSLNNWTPWINSNWLATALLVERDEGRRRAAVYKILKSLDQFLSMYHDDGGCDEGPGYWSRAGGSLFDCLELLHSASGGAIDFYAMPLVREIGRYIYRAHIADDWFVNFADAAGEVAARRRPRLPLRTPHRRREDAGPGSLFGGRARRRLRPVRQSGTPASGDLQHRLVARRTAVPAARPRRLAARHSGYGRAHPRALLRRLVHRRAGRPQRRES